MDTNFSPVLNKLGEIDAKLAGHSRQFSAVIAKLGEHDREFNLIRDRLDNHDQDFAIVFTKFVELEDRITASEDRIMGALDAQSAVVLRLGQEMASFTAWARRTEDKVNRHEKRLRKLEAA